MHAIIAPDNTVHLYVPHAPDALKAGYRAIPVVETAPPVPGAGMVLKAPVRPAIGAAVAADATELHLEWTEEPAPVPRSVSAFQARAALSRAGLLDAVEAAIAGMGGEAALAWEYATEFIRTGALLNSVATGLGLTEAQIDDLFRQAALIEA
jgi:hypothetical protein